MTTEQKLEVAQMMQMMESSLGAERARAFVALEIGHAKARKHEMEQQKQSS